MEINSLYALAQYCCLMCWLLYDLYACTLSVLSHVWALYALLAEVSATNWLLWVKALMEECRGFPTVW